MGADDEFGAETFDRFLYVAVTPGVTVIDTITLAADHRWIELQVSRAASVLTAA